jgi:3-mercaptopyruvate sulfurtransferase SseA
MRLAALAALLVASLVLIACAQSPDSPAGGRIPSTKDEVPRITVDDLWRNLQDGADIIVVDTRNKEEYAQGHIRGAISILDHVEEGQWRPPEGKPLVIY